MTHIPKYRQPWLQSARFDVPFILLAGWLAIVATLLLPPQYKSTTDMSVVGWVVLVLFIDVAHVYSTLFRTYLDKKRFAKYRLMYLAIPLTCYVSGVLLYALGPLVFWRTLAYLAVYHFIRQQYGFLRLYTRSEPKNTPGAWIDITTIYAATLYPLLYWHCTPGRNFNWFVEGDFLIGNSLLIKTIALYLYIAIIATYVIKELRQYAMTKSYNLPKNMVMASTLATWYLGIIYFNGDMAFTLLNVVAHGIPYMSLIWLYQQKENGISNTKLYSHKLFRYSLLCFIGTIIFLAYVEEGLWDGLIWREHRAIFSFFQFLPMIQTKEFLALLIPLLSLPQTTHYVLDGFIWKKEHF